MYNDDDFNWNHGLSLGSTGNFKVKGSYAPQHCAAAELPKELQGGTYMHAFVHNKRRLPSYLTFPTLANNTCAC